MPTLFQLPKVVGLPSARLTFTISGTTTPQNTYSDEALTTPNANPVVADANGVFGPIYLDPTLPSYRVKYETSALVLIYQQDGVSSTASTGQNLRFESTNPNLFLYDTDGTPNQRKYRVRASGAAFEVALINDAETIDTTILQYTGGVLYSGGTEVAVTSEGSFTGTFTGMTGTVTATFDYAILNGVDVRIRCRGGSGTSNANTMTVTGLPAALRRSSGQSFCYCEVIDNGNGATAGKAIIGTTDTIALSIGRTDVTANYLRYFPTSFTTSGVKGLDSGVTFYYSLV